MDLGTQGKSGAILIALGSIAYRNIVETASSETGKVIQAPFEGLVIGKYMQAVKQATISCEPSSGD